jgi:hypothetical protein
MHSPPKCEVVFAWALSPTCAFHVRYGTLKASFVRISFSFPSDDSLVNQSVDCVEDKWVQAFGDRVQIGVRDDGGVLGRFPDSAFGCRIEIVNVPYDLLPDGVLPRECSVPLAIQALIDNCVPCSDAHAPLIWFVTQSGGDRTACRCQFQYHNSFRTCAIRLKCASIFSLHCFVRIFDLYSSQDHDADALLP